MRDLPVQVILALLWLLVLANACPAARAQVEVDLDYLTEGQRTALLSDVSWLLYQYPELNPTLPVHLSYVNLHPDLLADTVGAGPRLAIHVGEAFFQLGPGARRSVLGHELEHVRLADAGLIPDTLCRGLRHELLALRWELNHGPTLGADRAFRGRTRGQYRVFHRRARSACLPLDLQGLPR